MRWAVRLGGEFCLGLWSATAPEPAYGQKRRLADRSAAERALLDALRLSARAREHSTISLAHTCGAGAALVGPPGSACGVDLVDPRRICLRHARAILTRFERSALHEVDDGLMPALAWGIKEAAAKATGDPAKWFPDGLTIEGHAQTADLFVRLPEMGQVCLEAGWSLRAGLLAVWVFPQKKAEL